MKKTFTTSIILLSSLISCNVEKPPVCTENQQPAWSCINGDVISRCKSNDIYNYCPKPVGSFRGKCLYAQEHTFIATCVD